MPAEKDKLHIANIIPNLVAADDKPLAGIAVAEGMAHLDNMLIISLSSAVTRLLQHSARPMDRYSQSLAAEAAAQTVTGLFYQVCHRFSPVWLDTALSLGSVGPGRLPRRPNEGSILLWLPDGGPYRRDVASVPVSIPVAL